MLAGPLLNAPQAVQSAAVTEMPATLHLNKLNERQQQHPVQDMAYLHLYVTAAHAAGLCISSAFSSTTHTFCKPAIG
jgi:hypothetical protein